MSTATPAYNPSINLTSAQVTALAGSGLAANGTALDNQLITGKSGGQTVIGGTATTEVLTLKANTADSGASIVRLNANGIGIGAAAAAGVGLDFTLSSAGSSLIARVNNSDNTSGSSHARMQIQTGGASGGDPTFLLTTGATDWSIGVDNSASDALVFSTFASLGTNDRLTIDVNGGITHNGGALATNATTGHFWHRTMAGTPTGAVADGAIVIDTTGHKIWVRDSGTWKGVVVA